MTTTTTLVHRVQNGPLEWWRKALVYEIVSPELGAEDLEQMHGVLDHVRSLGFDTVLMRPSLVRKRHRAKNKHHWRMPYAG